jgi:hypothetical protein
MDSKIGRCSICKRQKELVFSNNPLVGPICYDCVNEHMDIRNIEHANFYCRTHNIPFNPERWMGLLDDDRIIAKELISRYTKEFLFEHKDNLYYTDGTEDIWKQANKEWQMKIEQDTLLAAIGPIKKAFTERARIKWVGNYSFEELIQLENLFSSIVDTFNLVNPMQIDAVKKACKLGIEVDKAIASADEPKTIQQLSATYNSFVKAARIDDIIMESESDVIRNVAELVKYIEDSGFEFNYFDGVEKDIVDKTINIMKDYTRTLVLESTGLDVTLEHIKDGYEKQKQAEVNDDASSIVPIEEIEQHAKQVLSDEQVEIDNELDDENILEDKDYDEELF